MTAADTETLAKLEAALIEADDAVKILASRPYSPGIFEAYMQAVYRKWDCEYRRDRFLDDVDYDKEDETRG